MKIIFEKLVLDLFECVNDNKNNAPTKYHHIFNRKLVSFIHIRKFRACNCVIELN